jgi:hypothetical protein
VVDDQESADDRQPGGADQGDPPTGSGRSDAMGVVLRLPSGPATIDGTDPADGVFDQDSPDGADRVVGTQWTEVGPDSPGDVPGMAGVDLGSHGAHAAKTSERTDWAWVEEWRAGNEPTPWTSGLVLSVFSALVVGVAVWVLAAGLADRPVVAVLVNLLVAGGLAPAIWLSRGLPVLRWIGAGAAAGIVIGWIAALGMLPLPTP